MSDPREDTATPKPGPRPPSPAESDDTDDAISTYADATAEGNDTTVTPEPENKPSSSSSLNSSYTVVEPSKSGENTSHVPEVQITSPGGGTSSLEGAAKEGSSTGKDAARVRAGIRRSSIEGPGPRAPPKTKRARTSSKLKAVEKDQQQGGSSTSAHVVEPAFPEQGWDDDTAQMGTVLQYRTGEEIERSLTCTAKYAYSNLHESQAEWSFRKDFGDDDYIASGRLCLPPKCLKAYKSTRDNSYIFYVVEGVVSVRIHETPYILCQGGSFLVPRGNRYSIQNISSRPAKLHFVQARQMLASETDDPLHLSTNSRSSSPRRSKSSFLTSKIVILVSFILERLMKRFAKYQKLFQKLYIKYAMIVARSVRSGPKAYLAFFFLGFLIRGIGFRKSFVPTIRVMIGGAPSSTSSREIAG